MKLLSNISSTYFLIILTWSRDKSYVFFANNVVSNFKSIRWFYFLLKESLFVSMRLKILTYLWNSIEILFFNCFSMSEILSTLLKNFSKFSTEIAIMFIAKKFANMYLFCFLNLFNISKCSNYIAIIWFLFWIVIFMNAIIVISIMCKKLCKNIILLHNYTKTSKWETNTWEFAKTYVKDLIFRMRQDEIRFWHSMW